MITLALKLFIWTAQTLFFTGMFGLITLDCIEQRKWSATALMAVVLGCNWIVDYLLFLHWFA